MILYDPMRPRKSIRYPLTRKQLRDLARSKGVKRGRNTCDTVRNLADAGITIQNMEITTVCPVCGSRGTQVSNSIHDYPIPQEVRYCKVCEGINLASPGLIDKLTVSWRNLWDREEKLRAESSELHQCFLTKHCLTSRLHAMNYLDSDPIWSAFKRTWDSCQRTSSDGSNWALQQAMMSALWAFTKEVAKHKKFKSSGGDEEEDEEEDEEDDDKREVSRRLNALGDVLKPSAIEDVDPSFESLEKAAYDHGYVWSTDHGRYLTIPD